MVVEKRKYVIEKGEVESGKFFGVRHTQYILLFLCVVVGMGTRTVLTVAVVAMISDDPPNDNVPTYPEWSSKKNIMLSSFFWGNLCLQVVAGQLAKNYGPKLFLGAAIFISSIATALIPVCGAHFGYGGVIACRILQGLTQGFLFPCVHNLLSAWTPVSMRAKIGGLVYAGSPLGCVFSLPLTGVISASSMGWPSAFYLYGILGIAWSTLWFLLGSNSPSLHKTISLEERKYIEVGMATDEKEVVPTPWVSVFTSLPFLSIFISHCGQNWGYWTLLTEISSYMENILKYKIASNSFLSALPYFVQWLVSLILSPVSDLIVTRKMVSVGGSRKIFNSIGTLVPAASLFALTFVGSTQKEITIILLVVAVGLNAGTLNGFMVNHIDISPIHAGTLMGISNTGANIFSILAPLAVDATKLISGYEETNKALWNVVFTVAGSIYVATGLFYNLFGSGEVQSWNNKSVKEIKETKNGNRV